MSPKIAEISAYEARLADTNKPPSAPSVASEIVAEVDHVKHAVRKVPALKRSIAFVIQVLDAGLVAEREVLRLARLESISEKTLKRARAKLKVKASKKGRGGWFLSMTRAESTGKEGRNS